MEIKARMGAVDSLREALTTSIASVRTDMDHGMGLVNKDLGTIKTQVGNHCQLT